MPFTPELRQKVDQIRDYLYGGGYPDPVSNAEQLLFFFYFYLAETLDTQNAARARVLKQSHESLYAGEWALRNPLNAPSFGGTATIQRERFRWSQWARALSGENLVRFVRDEVFPFFTEAAERSAVNFMEGARLAIDEPTVLTQVLNKIDELRLDAADADTKGDLFEHVLKQIKQAGELGQFRTPRHIIRAIVGMIDPTIGETVYDPAAGTAGFLVAAFDHIKLTNSSEHGTEEVATEGKRVRRGHGDRLSAAKWQALQEQTFFGNDVDPKMVRLATMNLTLRGLPNVRILKRNVLTTEILFVKYMMESLRSGGRCGVIVPEGLLFGSTGAHKELRRQLIENHTVHAVLSLPGGVFQPYSGVKTSMLVFSQGRKTERVLFLHADHDGYKLDANHDTPIDEDDLPELVAAYMDKEGCWVEWNKCRHSGESRNPEQAPNWTPASAGVTGGEWTQKWWFADAAEIRANDFNLSAGRYRPMNQAAVEHRDPRELLDELAAIEAEIVEEVDALREALQITVRGDLVEP